ncbi:LCP family protein [Kitasatospora sp. NPDC057198]|uniref:LCP family protein n=1 Tax=Kitasatospora sp. NPDC057198 TaxID=3346046 RepID=UPI003639C130
MDGGANGAGRGRDGGDDAEEEFEVQLGAAFWLSGSGPEPELTARLVDRGLAAGRRRRRARQRRTVLLAGALTAVVAVGAGLLALPRDLPVERTSAVELAHTGPSPAPAPPTDGTTLLLVGTDDALGAQGGPVPEDLLHGDLHSGTAGAADAAGSADTIMLVHIPAGGGEVRQLSLPRDVLVPGTDEALGRVYLNAERAALQQSDGGAAGGERYERGREAGRVALLRAVEKLTTVRVDHYAEVSMAGFYRVAQALGGIPVCLNHPVDDPYSGARLPAGRQELGAAQALAFVRQRHGVGGQSDLERTRRGQALLAGVVEKLRSGGTLADASKLAALYRALDGSLVVDQGWSPVDFVRQVPALAAGKGVLQTLPVTTDATGNRLLPAGAARDLLLGDRTAPPGATATASPAAPAASAVPPALSDGPAATPTAPLLLLPLPEPVELGGVPCVD